MTHLFASSARTSRSARRRARLQRPVVDFTSPAFNAAQERRQRPRLRRERQPVMAPARPAARPA